MTRQVALGAVVAFAITVLVLSVCQPGAPGAEVSAAPVPVVAPPPLAGPGVPERLQQGDVRNLEPSSLRKSLYERGVLTAPTFKFDAGT